MIIFGIRGVKSTIESGDFLCPQCQQSTPYRYRKVTKFFTLYFIPIIPLGFAGEYVECGICKCTFIPRVLGNNSISKSDSKAIYEQAVKHSMVLIMLADGEIDINEKNQVLKTINRFCHNKLSINQLNDYIKKVQNEKEDISKYLKKVGRLLNEQGKETIIKCALSVAAADGNIDNSELNIVSKMARSMEISSSHLKEIFNSVNCNVSEQIDKINKEKEDKEDHSRFMPK